MRLPRPSATGHPWAGARVALGTMHAKERALGPPLARALGIALVVPAGLDTDAFGTFTGEVARAGTAEEAAHAKALAAAGRTGLPFGLGSEGSFGPDPAAPFVAAASEVLVLVDVPHGRTIAERDASHDTNFAHTTAAPSDPVAPFLVRIGAPSHAVIVRPNAPDGAAPIVKGLAAADAVAAAVARLAPLSADGRARIETDMRAHMNPTRMRMLRKLARALARRLATLCPGCGAPGFGRLDVRHGLRCEACGLPTGLVAAEIDGCGTCGLTRDRPRRDGRRAAPAMYCEHCNP